MKTFVILFTLFYFLNALAVAPYGIKGREQSATLYSNVHQFPNNQVTNLGGINALVETGNKNILINPSFEHSSFFTGWFNLGTASWTSDVSAFDGKVSATLSPVGQTVQIRQQSSINSAQMAGAQGLASIRVKSNVALKFCSFIDSLGATATNCVNVQANSQWGLYKVPFLLGSVSSGISVESVGNVTGTIYIDDAFVGAVDLKADVDSSKIAGESYFAGTTSCNWTRTSTTIGAFTSVAACPGPTIAYSSMGQWQTTDSDLPRQTINNLPSGVYKATFYVSSYQSPGGSSVFSINDGLTTCEAVQGDAGTSAQGSVTVSCTFTYASSGNRVFELYSGSSSGTVNIANIVTPRASTKFQLEYFGSSSVYSSNNADTDWASCGHTAASFTGFGTVSGIETQCKRQGSDLLMKGKFTAGASTAVEARMSLPLWNGVQLLSAGSSVIPSIQLAGDAVRAASGGTYFRSATLIEASSSYITFGSQLSTTGAISKALATNVASSEFLSITARIPIEGWQQSNIIIGQFNGLESCTSTLDCTDTFSAKVSAAGVVSAENTEFLNGNCTVATGTYTCNFNTSIFTVAPNCVAIPNNTPGVAASGISVIGQTSSAVTVYTYDNVQSARPFSLVCQKQGVDYVGKTAKAVASDQNLRTPGTTNGVIHSFSMSSAGVVSSDFGSLVSSCNATAPYTCTFNSSKFLSAPNCTCTNKTGNGKGCNVTSTSTTNLVMASFNTATGAPEAQPLGVVCHGVAP